MIGTEYEAAPVLPTLNWPGIVITGALAARAAGVAKAHPAMAASKSHTALDAPPLHQATKALIFGFCKKIPVISANPLYARNADCARVGVT